MASEVQNMTNLVGKDVFTSQGSYCGKVRDVELNLPKFKVRALVVDAAQGSYLAQKVGGKKGVIVPYSMVNAVNDVIMIRHFKGDVAQHEDEGDEPHEREQVEEAEL
jgi:sporulation protein YlmC with PRC-barrel domain